MINIVIGISFILIWFGTFFFTIYYIGRIRKELLCLFLDKSSLSKKVKGIYPEEHKSTARPFKFADCTDPKQLLSVIKQEHPQIIALILAYLDAKKSSVILKGLPCEIQSDVVHRIAEMDYADPEVCRKIEKTLEKKLSALSNDSYPPPGGINKAVEILNLIDESSRNHIIEKIKDENPGFAEKISQDLMALKK